MLWFRKPKSGRASRRADRARPAVELLEARDVPAGLFLQGRAFVDVNHDGTFDPGDPVLAGATVSLYAAGNTTTPLQTQTVGSNGLYSFTGLSAGNYQLVETPASGYANTAANANDWGLGGATAVQPNTIDVTLSSTPYYQSYDQYGPTEPVVATLNNYPNEFTSEGSEFWLYSGVFQTTLSGGALSAPTTVNTYCLNLDYALANADVTPTTSFVPSTYPGAAQAGQIGYLYQTFGNSFNGPDATTNEIDSAALQLALWKLTYDNVPSDPSAAGSLSNGNFVFQYAAPGAPNGDFTEDTALTNAITAQAYTYLADSIGQSAPVIFLDGPSNGSQLTIINGSLDFGNIASPTITTSQQPASATVGTAIADKATVSGGDSPTGTVTFNLYNSANGTGTLLFTDTENLVNGTATSKGYATTATGTDSWVATYSGDANNAGVTSPATSEPVTINQASPSITTAQQPMSATVGTSISDQATVSGGYNPTGTVTFNLYNSANGTGTLLFTDTENLVNGTATSKGYATTATGTDSWVATYSGDANNAGATSPATSEPVTINQASPTITTAIASTISGTKYLDLTGNGFSSDDTPQAGVTIDLYESVGNGVVLVGTTTTASNGRYSFTVTSPGVYAVTEAVPSGYVQTGGGPYGTAGDTYYVIAATGTGESYSGYNFDDYQVPTCTPTNICYKITTPNGCSTTVTNLAGNTQPGDTVTVTFTVPTTSTMSDQLTLVSYSAPASSFSDATAYQQVIYQQQTGTFAPSSTPYTLTVKIPNNDYQIDFVCGPAIAQLEPNQNQDAYGPDSAEITYHAEGRYISSDNGGTTAPGALNTAAPTVPAPTAGTSFTVGTPIADTATVGGGYNPTGTVTFSLYSNPNGTGTPLFTDTETLVNGTATSKSFTTAATGTDYWVATYNGNSNNGSVKSGTAAEPVSVTGTPSLSVVKTADQSTVAAGQTTGFTVTITNTGTAAAAGVTLSDPLPAGIAGDIKYAIDTTTGTPADFTITGSVGGQSLVLSSAFLTGGDGLLAGQSITVHVTGQTSIYDGTGTSTGISNGAGVSGSDAYLGLAGDYTVLDEGTGDLPLLITNVSIGGSIGVGSTGRVQYDGPGSIGGRVDFSAGNSGQYSNDNNQNVAPVAVNFNVSQVTTALATVNALSSSLKGLGATLAIGGTQTVNESSGQLDTINGVAYRVFNVTSYREGNGNVLTVTGDGSGDPVVFDFGYNQGVQLGGGVTLAGGLTADQVVWNFTSSGQSIQLNTDASCYHTLAFQGVILAPNDAMSVCNANLLGRIFGGGSVGIQIASGDCITTPTTKGTLSNTATVSATGLAAQQAAASVTVSSGAGTPQLAAGSASGAGDGVGEVITGAMLLSGEVDVAVDLPAGPDRAAEQTDIDDAIASLNAQIAPLGITFVEVSGAAADTAAVHITTGDETVIGGQAQGVLGAYTSDGTITLVNGWNWYFGTDGTPIAADQYDFQTVVTHELGHVLGLGENSDPTSAMDLYLGAGVARHTLTATDLSNVAVAQNLPTIQATAAAQAAAASATAAAQAAAASAAQPVATDPSTDPSAVAGTTGASATDATAAATGGTATDTTATTATTTTTDSSATDTTSTDGTGTTDTTDATVVTIVQDPLGILTGGIAISAQTSTS